MTIRRDLGLLETEGILTRVRGGATITAGSSYEPPFAVRARDHIEEKSSIARTVAENVNDGATIILDGGSTGMAIAEQLFGRAITVCPLSLRIASYLAGSPTIHLYIPGGTVRQGEQSLIGSDTIDYLEAHKFDQFIMTASGMTLSSGFTEWNTEDAAVKRHAIKASNHIIAAVDSSKFGQTAFVKLCSIETPDLIVTDQHLPDEASDQLRARHVHLQQTSTSNESEPQP